MSTWPTYERAPALAFLDVDGTLLAETTTYLFAHILRRRGLLKRSFMLRALYHGLQHKLGQLDYGRLLAFGLRSIATIPVVELEQIAQENFEQHVRPRLYIGAEAHFRRLREQGTTLVLVSSSPGIVLEPLRMYLGCEDALTTPVKYEKGLLVDLGDGPACYGEGKRYWAKLWAENHGFRMDEAAAYADNWSDRGLLGDVGRAIVVHPRGRLRRLARRKGWTIVRPHRPRDGRPGAVPSHRPPDHLGP